jgi:opacity protein-like surface antigen
MEQRLEWFGMVRGRFGVTPTPGSLVYATGGFAVGRIKTSGAISGSSLNVTEDVIPDVDPDGNPIEIPVVIASDRHGVRRRGERPASCSRPTARTSSMVRSVACRPATTGSPAIFSPASRPT